MTERSPEDVKRFLTEMRAAFPDHDATIENQLIEGDKAETRWWVHGTHQGEFQSIVPTGKEMEINGIGIYRFSEEGKVVESWFSYDQLSMMRQSLEQEMRMAQRIQASLAPQSRARARRLADG